MPVVSIFGAGQLGTAVAAQLSHQPRYDVRGPYGRAERAAALDHRADVVVIATTTRLADVADDVERAVAAGSNVLVSAEEAAFPFMVDRERADRIDALARAEGVSVAGVGVNPGFIFDALVLTMLGAAPRGCQIDVRRIVDISGFGTTVLRRIGVGNPADAFAAAVRRGDILGHAGFPQSMAVVADAIGATIDRIDRVLEPVLTDVDIDVPGRFVIRAGESAGVDQTYTAVVENRPWFTAHFYGHVDPASVGRSPCDDIDLVVGGELLQSVQLRPGIGAQIGSQNMVTNSIERIIDARPGWVTVAQLAPAFPAPVA
ncbi:2,4-diaminopentanoate dehydrogenase [soil metagenome]